MFGASLGVFQQARASQEWLAQQDAFYRAKLRLDLELARRDLETELRARQANRLKIMLMLGAVLFACCFSMIREGQPAYGSPPWLCILYTTGLALSFVALLLSIACVLRVHRSLSRYRTVDPHHTYSCGLAHASFTSFYHCHLRRPARLAVQLFYAGAGALMCCASLTFYSRLVVKYQSPDLAPVFGAVCLLFLLLVVVLDWSIDVQGVVLQNKQDRWPDQAAATASSVRSSSSPPAAAQAAAVPTAASQPTASLLSERERKRARTTESSG